jgi:hypothetical protein
MIPATCPALPVVGGQPETSMIISNA